MPSSWGQEGTRGTQICMFPVRSQIRKEGTWVFESQRPVFQAWLQPLAGLSELQFPHTRQAPISWQVVTRRDQVHNAQPSVCTCRHPKQLALLFPGCSAQVTGRDRRHIIILALSRRQGGQVTGLA